MRGIIFPFNPGSVQPRQIFRIWLVVVQFELHPRSTHGCASAGWVQLRHGQFALALMRLVRVVGSDGGNWRSLECISLVETGICSVYLLHHLRGEDRFGESVDPCARISFTDVYSGWGYVNVKDSTERGQTGRLVVFHPLVQRTAASP